MENKETSINIGISYSHVREQRQAIVTAIRVLNELASQVATCRVKAADHIMEIRNMLDERDSHLFEMEQELFFKLTR